VYTQTLTSASDWRKRKNYLPSLTWEKGEEQ
jgi:hypothetical protein